VVEGHYPWLITTNRTGQSPLLRHGYPTKANPTDTCACHCLDL